MLNPTQYLKRYGMAIASVVIALLFMLALDPVLQLTQASFLLFYGAVTISAFYGGRSPGIVATLLSAVFANYFFQYPQYAWTLNLAAVLRMALFIFEGVLITLVVGALRTAQAQIRKNFDRLKATEAEMKDLNQALQRQVDELQALAAAKLASEDRYRVLISSIDEGFGICEMLLDEDGKPVDFRILEVNPVFEPLTGLEQAVGKTARELVPDVEDIWFEIYGRVALTREPIRFEQKSEPLKRWFDINAFPIGEPESRLFGILFTNITARKALEQERERFLALGSDLQVITGSDGYFQWVSPTFERVLGWTVEEMTSRPWTEFVHPDDINPSVLEAEYLFKGSETLAFENRYRHKDGSYRWLLWKAQSDLEQQVLYGAAVDITERKRREANAAFLAEIAAEFSRLSSAQDIIQSVGAKLGRYLNLATCHLVEIDEAADHSSISECWRTPEAPVISGSYRISQFLTAEMYRALHAGETVAVNDTQNDSRVNAQAYAPTGVMGFVTVPFFRFGEWRYLLSATTSQVRNWREDEIELIQELSNRLFPRLERARAEDALRESEERFRQLAENIDVVFWIREVPEDQLTYISPAYERLWGLNPQELYESQRAWVNCIHPDDRELTDRAFQEKAAAGQFDREYRIVLPNGSVRWVRDRCFPLQDETGAIYRFTGIAEDITDRKQTEIQLQQQELEFRTLVENTPDIITRYDRELRHLYISPTIEQALGIPADQIIGKTATELGLTDPQSQIWYATLQHVFDTGESRSLEAVYPKPDGELRFYQSHFVPELREGKHVKTVVSFSRDITEYKRVEASLRQSEERLRVALEAAHMGTWYIDLNTGKGSWSEQHFLLLGYEPVTTGEASEQMWSSRLHPDDRERTIQLWQQSRLEHQLYRAEYRVIRADNGQIAWLAALGSFTYDQTGQAVRSLGVLFDISDRKQTEAEREQLLQREQAARTAAERANRIKDEFLSILSHELRSPLNPILGWSRLLQAQKFDEAKTKVALATIERNARLQTQLIDDLLDMSRILRGKLSLNEASVNLVFVIEAALEVVRTAADAKSISLLSELTDAGQVRGDNARLQQIVWNLLSNAIKFTPIGGRVNIRLDQVDDCAQVTIADTGRGISPEFLPYIFESFRQEDTSITRQHGGLGLGLSIVKYLVDAHGGTITADSPGEGQGATFAVKLPLLKDESTLPATNPFSPAGIDLTGVKVLAVDDNEDTRELLTTLLAQYGAEARVVASGVEVLALLNSFEPNVLVCDLGMPDMDGYSLLQQIRALPTDQGGQVPAIALSAYARDEDCQRALAHGFQRHIAKPIEPERLASAVAELGF